MKKIKVGIMTFWNSHSNYGQILQGYALQRYLEQYGCDAYIIRFNNFLSQIKEILTLIKKQLLIYSLKNHQKRRFNEFKLQIKYSKSIYHSFVSLRRNPPQVNLFIVGSDQVWTYMRSKERRNGYLLNFADNVKKISYAASFGRDNLKVDELDDFKTALSKLSTITVREKTGCDICEQLGFKAQMVIDPIALLNTTDWKYIEIRPTFKNNRKKNAFIYLLADEDKKIIDLTTKLQEEYNIYYTNPNGKGFLPDCTPSIPEWIGFIDKCDIVITDSYHCTLMSILLNTQFVTVSRTNGIQMNNRLLTLFEITELKYRYVPLTDLNEVMKAVNTYSKITWTDTFIKLIEDSRMLLRKTIECER
jgi:hypothetical protein